MCVCVRPYRWLQIIKPECLLIFYTQISGKAWSGTTRENFKLHISEGSAEFYENIEIDEEKDIEYFKVPPHNDLSETDRMYDFKMVRNAF